MRDARAKAQWERVQRTKAALPYLLYVGPAIVNDCETHAHWAGTILEIDHPWWVQHLPPIRAGCTCAFRAITKSERARLISAEIGPEGKVYRASPPDEVVSTDGAA